MQSKTEYLHDKNVIISVTYEAEKSKPQVEECHGLKQVGKGVTVELKSVDVNFRDLDRPIDILPLLHPGEREFIILQLNLD